MKKYLVTVERYEGENIEKVILSNKTPEELYEELYEKYDLYDDELCIIKEM